MDSTIARGFRLSPQQQRLWLLQAGEPRPAFLSRCALRLQGEVDRPALSRALETAVARYEILRTAFPVLSGMTLPLQQIRNATPSSLPIVDLRALSPALQEAEAGAVCAGLAAPPFDPEAAAPLRAAFVRLAEGDAELILILPALCADLSSLETLAAQIFAQIAGSPSPGDEEPLQAADIAEWQHQLLEGEETAEGVERWRELWRASDLAARLDDPAPMDEEPEEGARTHGPFAPASLPVSLPVDTTRPVTADLALAAWLVVLWRSTGERPEELVGVLHGGRRYAELAHAVGPLARYLPVVLRLTAETTAGALLVGVRQACAEAARRQELFSWDRVAGEARGRFFPACFQAVDPAPPLEAGGLRGRITRREAILDRFALELVCAATGAGASLTLRYDPRRLRRASAALLAERLSTLLQFLTARPEALETPLRDLEVLGPGERHRLLDLADGPSAAVPEDCLHHRLTAQAALVPERTAVTGDGESLTFAGLDARANRLAHHLRSLGAGPETRVAVLLERSVEAVAALLAVLKAGAAWVPLDPASPADRLRSLLADAGAALAVATRTTAAHLAPEAGARVILLDEDAAAISSWPDTAPTAAVLPESLAYVIYTSGSTGRPKGVMVHHCAPLHLLAGLAAAALVDRPAPLRASLNAPLLFDASVQQLVLLLAGHTLCVVPEAVRTDGSALLAWLRERAVDLLDCTPSQLRLLLAAGLLEAPDPIPGLVFCAGEAMDQKMWSTLGEQQRSVFFNIYGPTECTVDATAWRVGGGRVTIGRPLAGYATFVLDAGLRPVPLGAPGELCIGGGGLARGYLGRPDVTAERFVPHPLAARPGERLYRSGDLVRHRPDGTLEFLGRIDLQVKIRGYRVEPGEIEAALIAHPWVEQAVVIARRDAPSSPEQVLLTAYVTPTAEAPPGLQGLHTELQRFLANSLPAYLVPAAYVPLPALPLTPTGKVDRRALLAPDRARLAGSERVLPRNLREAALAAIWAEVLGLDAIGIDDSFFAFGGDSIRSLQVQALAREQGIHFSVQDLFQHQTVRELAGALPKDALPARADRDQPFALLSEEARPYVPAGVEDAYPLTRLQTGMLFHNELSPESGIYQDLFSFSIRGTLDLPALEEAVAEIMARHPVLRSSFDLATFPEPVQLVHRQVRVPLEVKDLSQLPPAKRQMAVEEYVRTDASRPFDWTVPPLLRICVHRHDEEQFSFTLTEHHALLDGWSVASLLTELFQAYRARLEGRPSPLPPPPPPFFREYVALELESLQWKACRDYWARSVAGRTGILLPRLPGAPGDSAPLLSHITELQLPDAVSAGLHQAAREASVPLKSVFLAAHLRVLCAITGEPDVTTGFSSDGRPEETGADRALGIFVAMLPFRHRLNGGTWRELAREVFAAETGILPFRRFPMPEIKRLADGDILFETAFNFTHFHVYREIEREIEANAGLAVTGRSGFEVLDIPLTVNCYVDPYSARTGVALNCHLNVLSQEQIDEIAGCYLRVLTAIASDPEGRYDLFSPLAESAAARLRAWTCNPLPLDGAAGPAGAHDFFTAQSARTPEAPAVEMAGERLTYRELDERSARLARCLRAAGVGADTLVGLSTLRSFALPVALLGILRAGGAYVPLDPAYPRERLAFMRDDSGLRRIVAQEDVLDRLPELELPMMTLDRHGEAAQGLAEAPLPDVGDPECLAYVLYTSGSTGRPKGVAMPHRALINLIAWQLRDLPEARRTLQFASPSFDVSFQEMLSTWASGGTLVLLPEEVRREPAALARSLVEQRIERVFLPFVALQQLTEATGGPGSPEGAIPAALREVITAGEALQATRALVALFSRLPDCRLYNQYGPTEAHVVTSHRLPGPPAGWPVLPPIGRPIANLRIHLLDPWGAPIPVGVAGRLHIGGEGLARGYLERPDLTAERFVPDDTGGDPGARLYATGDLARWLPGGEIEFLGRTDHQVKVRGFRIEPGEIEAALASHPAVRESAVVVRDPGEARHLVAFVVSAAGAGTSAPAGPELAAYLRDRLPEHMVPSAFLPVEELPLTPSGKVDRRTLARTASLSDLPRPELSQGFVAPRTPTEEVLAGLFAQVLGIERLGVNDSLLELGVHSLLAIQLVSRIRHACEVDLPLRTLLEAGSVARLAVAVVKAQAERVEHAEIDRLLSELEGLTEEESRLLLAREADEEATHG